jgi:hypothetical protein
MSRIPAVVGYLGSEASTQTKKLESSCNFMLKSTILLLYSVCSSAACNYRTVSDCKSAVAEKFLVKLESSLRTQADWITFCELFDQTLTDEH